MHNIIVRLCLSDCHAHTEEAEVWEVVMDEGIQTV